MTDEQLKRTPGPWLAHGRYIGTKKHMSAVAECRDVNGNWSDDAKSSENAHLIAAAPELLDALKAMMELHAPRGTAIVWDGPYDAARAAIAKAEGRA